MLRTVTLYGDLAEEFGKTFYLDVKTPAEAIKAICANRPGFKQRLYNDAQKGAGYQILVGKNQLKEDGSQLDIPTGKAEIKIIPVIAGAKKKGLLQIILAAVVLYAVFGPMGAEMGFTEAGALTAEGQMAASFAVNMAITGIGMMLAPTPKQNKDPDERENYAFNGPQNTVRQGVPVPVCYGQLIVGGAVVSAGITTEVVTDVTSSPAPSGTVFDQTTTVCIDHYATWKYDGAGNFYIETREPSGSIHTGRGDCGGNPQGTVSILTVTGYSGKSLNGNISVSGRNGTYSKNISISNGSSSVGSTTIANPIDPSGGASGYDVRIQITVG